MSRMYIGIDNGVTGTVGVIYGDESWLFETPVKVEQSYTKAKNNISRIDMPKLLNSLNEIILHAKPESVMCLIERPMVNPTRFKASMSALRALESTVICLELMKIPFQYEDSKAWQRELLPKGSIKEQLKKDSIDIGLRLFPKHETLIRKHKDADGLLLAEYCRRKF